MKGKPHNTALRACCTTTCSLFLLAATAHTELPTPSGQKVSAAHSLRLDGNTNAWYGIEYTGDPWVFNVSRPYFITQGLQNRHLSVWASHGRYYDAGTNRWKWQRPNLFCTNEDLFTQTIVVPFLIPMLQNAGAIVFTPRERDWQKHEVIVDNDDAVKRPYYLEVETGKKWKACDSVGFAARQVSYTDGENPFRNGTVRQAKATRRKNCSEISYQPNIPEAGRYAVYVSYATLPKSVPDAKYIVYHKGQATEFTVNQRMGGGTWVYLGTFDFDGGCNAFNRVVVTNHASKRGVVTTDAVRFGGGMGNITRGGYRSGLPRCLEGARYYAQWAGAPYAVYGGRNGANDYADDINTRSLMTNWLGGGSVYMPALEGGGVPIELSLALHSDAGYNKDGRTTWGPLAICTTDFNDGMLCSGVSRMTSKDFAQALLKNLVSDMQSRYGDFSERYLWDRNYSETRLPEVPSAIIEMLSHQSFPDMKIAQDPEGKFWIARSIYKTILRYVSSNHGKPYTVQPLAPDNFSAVAGNDGYAHLSWNPQADKDEPSAMPDSYIVYTACGKGGYDNGTVVKGAYCKIPIEQGKLYRFKVAAVNRGGESFPSEELCVLKSAQAKKNILIVNNFHRLAAPQVIDNDSLQGFDMDQDPGVSYGLTAGWIGKQLVFDRRRMGVENSSGLGYCGEEMAGDFMAGNDFNYVAEHAAALAASGKYNMASCSVQALLSGKVKTEQYHAIDLINGLERNDGYTHTYYKTFTPLLQRLLRAYTQGGGALLVSGSYTGADMLTDNEQAFLADVLKVSYEPTGTHYTIEMPIAEDSTVLVRDSIVQTSAQVTGLGLNFAFHNTPNAHHYAATHPEILKPQEASKAFTAMRYSTGTSAAVAYRGNDYRSLTVGFPVECITDERLRKDIMSGILKFLTE